MIFSGFRINIIIRALLLVIVAFLLTWSVLSRPSLFILATLSALFIVAVIELIRYVERSTRNFTHFLMAVRQRGFTEAYPDKKGKAFENLSGAMHDIIEEFARINREKEVQFQFLETLNENISVSIFSFDENGKLLSMNTAAKKLLPSPVFTKVDDFKSIDPKIVSLVRKLEPEQRSVLPVYIRGQRIQLGIHLKRVIVNNERIDIVMIQDLNHELEAKEIEAWHLLMRVLTHEIMNSVTPIASLSAALKKMLIHDDGTQKRAGEVSDELLEDLVSAIETIRSRSTGLLNFTRTYKDFSKPIMLHRERADLNAIVQHVLATLRAEIESKRITVELDSPSQPMYAEVDRAMIEQVLINIVTNAFEAVSHDGTGKVAVMLSVINQRPAIIVSDNGRGIDAEIEDRVFVPFFTTKENGSGIGLSLSRQIMKQHGGNISFESSKGRTAFRIEF